MTRKFLMGFVLILVSWITLPGSGLAGGGESELSDEAVQVRELVEQILPKKVGVRITRVVENQVPDGWITNDKNGILVEIYRGSAKVLDESERELYACQVYFLPHDWIGILPVHDKDSGGQKARRLYWTDSHKIYIDCPWEYTNYFVGLREGKSGGEERYLWEKSQSAFGEKQKEMESKVEALLKEHCSNDACRSEAARSLSIMKVPAVETFIDCVKNLHDARASCIQSLGFVGGRKADDALKELIDNSKTTDTLILKASESLVRKLGEKAGRYITRGLRKTTNLLTAEQLVGMLVQIGYKNSADSVYQWLKKDAIVDHRSVFINALAVFEFREAKSRIKKICKEHNLYSEGLSNNREYSVSGVYKGNMTFACRNYLGPWGKTTDGLRFQLIPPEKVEKDKQAYVVLVLRNDSGVAVSMPTKGDITFVVDGKELSADLSESVDNSTIGTLKDRSFHVLSMKLPKAVKHSGKHKLQAKSPYHQVSFNEDPDQPDKKPLSGAVLSNEVEIEVAE